MWLLSVKRSHFHDMYDLLRAPMVTFVFLLIMVILKLLTKFTITTEIKVPLEVLAQGPNWSASHQIMTWVSLGLMFMQGLANSFVSVILVESVNRFRRKRTLNQ